MLAPDPASPTNGDLSPQRAVDFFKKYWIFLVLALVVLMGSIGAYQYYLHRLDVRADAGSIVFFEAKNALDEKHPADALALLDSLHTSTTGYTTIGYFASALVYLQEQNVSQARAQLVLAIDDGAVPTAYQSLARLYVAILYYNEASYDAAATYLEPLLVPSSPWYLNALEVRGLIQYALGDYASSYQSFRSIADHGAVSAGQKKRIEDLMVLASAYVHTQIH